MEFQYLMAMAIVGVLELARPVWPAPEPITGPRCTYTFILPQQKFTGAVCWSSVRPPPEPPGPNRSEVEDLRHQLSRQQAQMDELRRLVEVDGAVVSEVKALRKESRNVNARVTQLYTQMLHEILQRRERPVPASHLEGRVANASAEAVRVAANYRQLESKYQALAALVNNQSALISRLERECQQGMSSRMRPQPPLVPVIPHNPASLTNESRAHFNAINDIQRDQTAPAQAWPLHKASVPPDGTVLSPDVVPTKSTGNCAHYQKGGWWYNMCAHSNLNGVWYKGGHYRSRYQDGVYWAEFRGGAYSLRKVTMMIRSTQGS
ncbi:hypothetical protein JD844_010292 [Phrynosoma platyrhinos]|uniref:Fibrinogen C-terminal domain-containing protein n=1 Tax=Phrynosoma platyrhinos TaxID=52577 RepID=A0ABQ7TH82_PHRPL|nr:hypothetical protein JD844_010292 [Phrynosoma platyrhinos]